MRALKFVELDDMFSDKIFDKIFVEIQAMIEVLKLRCNEIFHDV